MSAFRLKIALMNLVRWNIGTQEIIFVLQLKGYITDLHGGVVLRQLNYPISTLLIIIRSVDRIVNDH